MGAVYPVVNTRAHTDSRLVDESASGYVDSGGMRTQWGVGTGGTAIVFSAPFGNTNYGLSITPEPGVVTSGRSAHVDNGTKATTGFTPIVYDTNSTANVTETSSISWIAVGLTP